MKKKLSILAVLLFFLGACSVSDMEFGGDQATVSASGDPVVTLVKASSMPWGYLWASFVDKTILIRVKNLAYDKEVVAHYELADGTWMDMPASYFGPADDGYELWKVSNSFTEDLGDEFVIRYTVNGQTYWDNNQGNNYILGDSGKIFGYYHNILQDWAGVYEQGGVNYFYGNVALKNLAYEKVVEVIYTTDNWNTTQVASAEFQRPDGDTEIWYFNVSIGSATQVEYAYSYTLPGTSATYWDNNWGQNYTEVLE